MKNNVLAMILITLLIMMFSCTTFAQSICNDSDDLNTQAEGSWYLLGRSYYEVYIPNTLKAYYENNDVFSANLRDEENNYEIHIVSYPDNLANSNNNSSFSNSADILERIRINNLCFDYFEFDDSDLNSSLVTHYMVYRLNDNPSNDGIGFFSAVFMYTDDSNFDNPRAYISNIVNSLRKHEHFDKLNEINLLPCDFGAKSVNVQKIKKRLQRLGYFRSSSKISDDYNSDTLDRIEKFQKDHDLQATGIVDIDTILKLYD